MEHPQEQHTDPKPEVAKPLRTASAVLGDGRMVELVYDRGKHQTSLAVWTGETWTLQPSVNRKAAS